MSVEWVRSQPRSCSSLLGISHFFRGGGKTLMSTLPEGTTPPDYVLSHCDWMALDFEPVMHR